MTEPEQNGRSEQTGGPAGEERRSSKRGSSGPSP